MNDELLKPGGGYFEELPTDSRYTFFEKLFYRRFSKSMRQALTMTLELTLRRSSFKPYRTNCIGLHMDIRQQK